MQYLQQRGVVGDLQYRQILAHYRDMVRDLTGPNDREPDSARSDDDIG